MSILTATMVCSTSRDGRVEEDVEDLMEGYQMDARCDEDDRS